VGTEKTRLSERWWRRRRRLDPWFGYAFEEADKMERIMGNMIRQAFGSPAEREKARRRYVQINEEYEPLVDLFVDEANVVIVAELPGIDKESIEVDTTEDKVTISVDSLKSKFFRELTLPARIDPRSSIASYKNGVLEVHLKKIADRRLFIK
jgi:HSP20 family molecular chaperone IbpA